MSFANVNHHVVSLEAAVDLSTKQFRAITVNSNGKAAVSDATALSVGVLQNNPPAGQGANVAWGGITKAIAGGSITAGARVTSDANGALIAATTAGDSVVGVALANAAAGDVFAVLLGRFPFVALA